MDGFFVGILFVAILSLTMFSSCTYGENVTENNLSKDCDDFGVIRIKGSIYECKLIENNSK